MHRFTVRERRPMKGLKKIRAARFLTLKQVGAMIGKNHPAIAKYEKGTVWAPPEVVAQLAEALGVTEAELWS